MAARMQSAKPARKIWVGALAAAGTTLIVFILNTVLSEDKQIPAEIAASLVTVLTIALSYAIPPATDDRIVVA